MKLPALIVGGTVNRIDETWKRLVDWTSGQAPSERLAAQVLIEEEFKNLDPSHPLGGRDSGKDAVCERNGQQWIMAVYFPRGQQSFKEIKVKFLDDFVKAKKSGINGFVFVTNQELRLSEREDLRSSVLQLVPEALVQIYHLERVATILEKPSMASVRRQFLGINEDASQNIDLGGRGGASMGAGGGGGGAIGENARGGSGGKGGDVNLQGHPGMDFGAGGGGGGAIGRYAFGGKGGEGGESVSAIVSREEFDALKAAGFERIECVVGRGGKGGEYNQDGAPGENSIIKFVAKDGTVLKSVVARGGLGGNLNECEPLLSQIGDVSKIGFNVSAIILAELIHLRNGLFYFLGAGWESFTVDSIPAMVQWPLYVAIRPVGLSSTDSVDAFVQIIDESGTEVIRYPAPISDSTRFFMRVLEFQVSSSGIWTIQVVTGKIVVASLQIEVKKKH
jgi:hypothetical protein